MNFKTVEVELPFYSEISYEKKGETKYDLVQNKNVFKLKFDKDVSDDFIQSVILLWKMHAYNIENKIINIKMLDKNKVLADRAFFAKNTKIYETEFGSQYYEDRIKYLQDISDIFDKMNLFSFKNKILDEKSLSKLNIISDNVNITKNLLEKQFEYLVFYEFERTQNKIENIFDENKLLSDFIHMFDRIGYDKGYFTLSPYAGLYSPYLFHNSKILGYDPAMYKDINDAFLKSEYCEKLDKHILDFYQYFYEKMRICFNDEEFCNQTLRMRSRKNVHFKDDDEFMEKAKQHVIEIKNMVLEFLSKYDTSGEISKKYLEFIDNKISGYDNQKNMEMK